MPVPTLRDYQESGVASVRQSFLDGHNSVLLVAPTGSGKTVLASHIVEGALQKGRKILILAHLRILVRQMAEALISRGIPVSLCAEGIITREHPVTVGTPHTWIGATEKPEADFLIIDEAHHVAEGIYEPVLEAFRGRYPILGLTATPFRSTVQWFDAAHAVIDSQSLIHRGVLSPARYMVWDVQYEETETGGRRRIPPELDSVVSEWKAHACERKTLVFCNRVSESMALVERFQAAGIPAAHVDASTPNELRDSINQKHRDGEYAVVSNVGIYLEGYDNPAIDCVILLRACGGEDKLSLYVQMIGRGLRQFPGKTDCLVLDFAGNFSRFGAAEQYIPELDIIEDEETEERFKRCPACLATIPLHARICPECFENLVAEEERTATERIRLPAQLRVVSSQEIAVSAMEKRRLLRRARQARTLEELRQIARELGYKPGWAWYRWKFMQQSKRRASG